MSESERPPVDPHDATCKAGQGPCLIHRSPVDPLREACVRSAAGMLCNAHGGKLWPWYALRCNGWIALASPAAPDDLVLVRRDSGGVFPDGTTNHPAIDFAAEPPVASPAAPRPEGPTYAWRPDYGPDGLPETALPERVVVGANGAYWRDYGEHYSMCPVSEDNDPVEVRAVYARVAALASPATPRPEGLDVERLTDAMMNEYDRQVVEGAAYPKGYRGRAERLAAEYQRLSDTGDTES